MVQAAAHVGRVGGKVLEDDRQHDLCAVRVRRADEIGQLARVPHGRPGVTGESPVVLHMQPEEGHGAYEREIPRRIAHGGVAQAAGEGKAKHLSLWPGGDRLQDLPSSVGRATLSRGQLNGGAAKGGERQKCE